MLVQNVLSLKNGFFFTAKEIVIRLGVEHVFNLKSENIENDFDNRKDVTV